MLYHWVLLSTFLNWLKRTFTWWISLKTIIIQMNVPFFIFFERKFHWKHEKRRFFHFNCSERLKSLLSKFLFRFLFSIYSWQFQLQIVYLKNWNVESNKIIQKTRNKNIFTIFSLWIWVKHKPLLSTSWLCNDFVEKLISNCECNES